jgi:hypothetical protein
MRILHALLSTAISLFFISCSNDFSMTRHNQKPKIVPDSEKATLVIYRGTSFGYGVTMATYLDNKFVGQTKGASYFITKAEPGIRSMTGIAEKNIYHQLTLEAGKIYYINQGIYPGLLLAESKIILSDEHHFLKRVKNLTFYFNKRDPHQQAFSSRSLRVAGVTFRFDITS